jgi:hypothetical protein
MRTKGWSALLVMPTLLLAACGCAQEQPAQPEPRMDKRLIADEETGEGWTSAEATMTAARAPAREGSSLHFHIGVDHTTGEPNYPIGWPRTYYNNPEDRRDWSQWDFLDFWLYTETSREALPGTPLGLILRCPDRAGSWDTTLTQAAKNEWVHFRFPLADIPNISNCAALQFFISESNYNDKDVLDFYVDELALLRYAEPTIVNLRPLQAVVFGDEPGIRVEVDTSGMKGGERRTIELHLKRDDQESATLATEVAQGRQTLLLSFGGDRLDPGQYTLEAALEGSSRLTTSPIRVVTSPWEE